MFDLSKLNNNFVYSSAVDIDYDVDYSCEDYGCNEEGICRCGSIENVSIRSFDAGALAREILIPPFDEFTLYCTERIISAHKLYDSSHWDFDVSGGYYGDELDAANIIGGTIYSLKAYLGELKMMTASKGKLFTALRAEYGYVLDDLDQYDEFEVRVINTADLIFPRKDHYARLISYVVDGYHKYDLPRCVVLPSCGKYKVVDGYNRGKANKDVQIKVITPVC